MISESWAAHSAGGRNRANAQAFRKMLLDLENLDATYGMTSGLGDNGSKSKLMTLSAVRTS
jgi:hypothetical protein